MSVVNIRKRIRKTIEAMENLTYYEVLGIKYTYNFNEITNKFNMIVNIKSSELLLENELTSLYLQTLLNAYSFLIDDEKRTNYNKQLEELDKIRINKNSDRFFRINNTYEFLQKYIGKSVEIDYWSYGNRRLEFTKLIDVSGFEKIILSNKELKFIGNFEAIVRIRDIDSKEMIYENEYVDSFDDEIDDDQVMVLKHSSFGNTWMKSYFPEQQEENLEVYDILDKIKEVINYTAEDVDAKRMVKMIKY